MQPDLVQFLRRSQNFTISARARSVNPVPLFPLVLLLLDQLGVFALQPVAHEKEQLPVRCRRLEIVGVRRLKFCSKVRDGVVGFFPSR